MRTKLVKVEYTFGEYDGKPAEWFEKPFRWEWVAWLWSYYFTFINPGTYCRIMIHIRHDLTPK